MRLDLHVHSSYSSDGKETPAQIVRRAKAVGLGGIAVADHNTPEGALKALEAGKAEGFLVVPAIEVSSSEGHVLAYGVREPVKRGLSAAETVEAIHALGGIAVAPHPYRFWSGLGEAVVRKAGFDALEVHNARSTRGHNAKALHLARELGVGGTGGSDAHTLARIGQGVTVADDGLDADGLVEAIRKGKTSGEGQSRGAGQTVDYVFKSVTEWFGRGFKKM